MKCVRAAVSFLRHRHASSITNCTQLLQATSSCRTSAYYFTLCRPSSSVDVQTEVDTHDGKLPDVEIDRRTSLISDDDVEVSDAEQDDRMDPLALREVSLDEITRNIPVSCNLAAYVNRSETLQQFLKLGVDLSRWDEKPGVAEFVLKMDFERDVKERLRFLHDVGVTTDSLGRYLTVNPFVLREDEDDLRVRINYLRSKKFGDRDIARIVSAAPLFLLRTTESIDGRLGYLQKTFSLSGNEVRFVATRQPKLLINSFTKIKEKQFILKEEFGFEPNELRQLLVTQPRLWLIGRKSLHERFEYVHNTMGISHQLIVHFPGCLTRRLFAVKQRHLFLVSLGRAQYDPKTANYVSMKDMVSGSDAEFCRDIAKTSVERFNEFLKTL